MSAMNDYLIGEIEDLSRKTGYPFEALMNQWFAYSDECVEDGEPVDWDFFKTVTLERDWGELEAPADTLWMVTVAPNCEKPVVRCAESGQPYRFAVTVMGKRFSDLPKLIAEAFRKVRDLRRGMPAS